MDPFELLKADHNKVAELFDRLDEASGQEKLRVFSQIKSELELHTHIEEKVFYPALEPPKETHDLTLEAYEEHNVVKTLLRELSGATSADDEWQAKAKVLRENVEHHVKEEEGELFDKADDALTDEELDALGSRMEAEKARKLGAPVPPRSTEKKGIVSRIKELVGLGSDPESKGPASSKQAVKKQGGQNQTTKPAAKKSATKKKSAPKKKSAAKKTSASKTTKKAGSKKSTKKTVKRAAKKKKSGSSRTSKSSKKRTRAT